MVLKWKLTSDIYCKQEKKTRKRYCDTKGIHQRKAKHGLDVVRQQWTRCSQLSAKLSVMTVKNSGS